MVWRVGRGETDSDSDKRMHRGREAEGACDDAPHWTPCCEQVPKEYALQLNAPSPVWPTRCNRSLRNHRVMFALHCRGVQLQDTSLLGV